MGQPMHHREDGIGLDLQGFLRKFQRAQRSNVVKLMRRILLMRYTHAKSIAQDLKQKTCQTQEKCLAETSRGFRFLTLLAVCSPVQSLCIQPLNSP